MFTGSLVEEVKGLEGEIESVKNKVNDPVMCAKVRQFVYAPREIQTMFKNDAGKLCFYIKFVFFFLTQNE